jgi:hypothetical protein
VTVLQLEASVGDANEEEEKAEEEMEEPLSLEWPDTRRKQATYLILLPIVFPLWLTVPDVRNPVRTHPSVLPRLDRFDTLSGRQLLVRSPAPPSCVRGVPEQDT